MNAALQALASERRARVEACLEARLPDPDTTPAPLHQAMRYGVLGGGKRLRALLVYASGAVLDAPMERLDGPACAVELLHAYSLIHDDLPAMDDDDLRRGKPSCHKAFDEATAILAGDALQSLAFEILAERHSHGPPPAQQLEALAWFARAVGSFGMCGGQALDLAAEGKPQSLEALEQMHAKKTGALIRASVRLGALCADAPPPLALDNLDRYARALGLAFQIRDDVLDVEGDTEVLGKPSGSDEAALKSTYPALLGLEASKAKASELCTEALGALSEFDERAEPLRALAQFAIARSS